MTRAIGRLYRLLAALLLPRRIRRRLGDDMAHTFEVALRDARRRRRVPRFLRRELTSLVVAAVRARRGSNVPAPRRRDGDRRRGSDERSRETLTVLVDDLGHAARSLRRSPGQVAFIVGTLALAIGASTTIYGAARYTVFRPLPYDNADRMVGIYRRLSDAGLLGPTADIVDRWTSSRDVFASTETYGVVQRTLTGRGEPAAVDVALVSDSYFDFLGIEPALGRGFTSDEVDRGDRVVLLGYELWRRRFGGDPGVLGTAISLDGDPWTVIGIGPEKAPPPMAFVDQAGAWAPFDPDRTTTAIATLAPGVTVEDAQSTIDAIVEREHGEGILAERFQGAAVGPGEMVSGRLERALGVLAVAVGLLLFIACLNVGGILINRADATRHETAVRVALGIGAGRLLRQHLLRSLLLAALACLLGIVLAHGAMNLLLALRPDDLASLDRMRLDGPVLVFALGATLTTALLFGLAPSLTARSRRSTEALRGGVRIREDRAASRARWVLVAGEISLSFAMLVGSGLLMRTVWELGARDPGFRPEGVTVARVDLPSWKYGEEERPALWRRLEETLEGRPRVSGVALTSGLPTRPGIYFGDLAIEGVEIPEDRREEPFFGSTVDEEYFEVLGQRIVSGRTFEPDDLAGDTEPYVLGESAARELWHGRDPVGGRMRLSGDEYRPVVGIVSDVVSGSSGEPDHQRQLYVPLGDDDLRRWSGAWLVVRASGSADGIVGDIRDALRAAEPDLIVDVRSLDAHLADTISAQRFTMILLGVLAAVAALLSSLGLYGVVSQVVGRRTREIGIRMSLGADRTTIAAMVLRSGLAVTAIGMALGTLAAIAAGRVLASQLFGVEPNDPPTLLGSAALLGLAALLATYLPARQAARTDPVRAISEK